MSTLQNFDNVLKLDSLDSKLHPSLRRGVHLPLEAQVEFHYFDSQYLWYRLHYLQKKQERRVELRKFKSLLQLFCNCLRSSGRTGIIASEEEDVPVAVEETYSGNYIVVFDPIDGSANIDTALTTGSIFGIYGPDEQCLVNYDDDTVFVLTQIIFETRIFNPHVSNHRA